MDDDAARTPYIIFGNHVGHGYFIARLNDDMISLAEEPARIQIEDISEPAEPPWKNLPDEHMHPDMRIPQWYDLTAEERRHSILSYYALCSYVDAQVEKIIAVLEQTGDLKNTNILFTADHGEMLGERHGQFKKYCLYESSVRVPLIVAGPPFRQPLPCWFFRLGGLG